VDKFCLSFTDEPRNERASGPKPSISILIADDHPLIRGIVKSTLSREPHFDVVGEAARRIRQKLPQTAIVILSSDVDKRFIAEAKKVGARACVPKSEAALALVKAIEAAINNDEFFVVE
jgi:DNA-binding NarL/FixJ family response regulator